MAVYTASVLRLFRLLAFFPISTRFIKKYYYTVSPQSSIYDALLKWAWLRDNSGRFPVTPRITGSANPIKNLINEVCAVLRGVVRAGMSLIDNDCRSKVDHNNGQKTMSTGNVTEFSWHSKRTKSVQVENHKIWESRSITYLFT